MSLTGELKGEKDAKESQPSGSQSPDVPPNFSEDREGPKFFTESVGIQEPPNKSENYEDTWSMDEHPYFELKRTLKSSTDNDEHRQLSIKTTQLNVIIFGSKSSVQFGDDNILLGPEHHDSKENHFLRKTEVSGHMVSVINLLDLHESDSLSDPVDNIQLLISERNIHAFIFVLKLGHNTDADKLRIEWLQKQFGESSLSFIIILFTYEEDEERDAIKDDLKNPVLIQLNIKCKNRYHTCSKNMNNESEMKTLLEKIDLLVSENKSYVYCTTEFKVNQCDNKDDFCPSQEITKWIKQNKSDHGLAEDKDEKNIQLGKMKQLLKTLNLEKFESKMKTSDVIQLSKVSLYCEESCEEKDLIQVFLQRLLMLNYKARYINTDNAGDLVSSDQSPVDKKKDFGEFFSKKTKSLESELSKTSFHPMDVQMAVLHCSDHFLKQLLVTKLSQCQYALPLLVPNPFTREIEFPMWTFRQIKKSWRITDSYGKKSKISKTLPVCEAQTPMVAFFRFGSISTSKSQLMNSLINEKHQTFFHRHCFGSITNSILMDGVVEVAWFCPSGEKTDNFSECVAFCNLHGDAAAESNKQQLDVLTEMSSVNVVLVSDLEDKTNKEIVLKLFNGPKPLICLLTEDESGISETNIGKYKIGLKDRNQSDVSMNLRTALKRSVLKSESKFTLKDLIKNNDITTDENDGECNRGRKAAINILERKEISRLKEVYLPCQGKPWHDWCQVNKDLHRLKENNLEIQKIEKKNEMKRLRELQLQSGPSDLIQQFVHTLTSLTGNEKIHFLKWIEILLEKVTSDDLSALHHEYDKMWTKVLDLQKKHEESAKIAEGQQKLEKVSEKLSASMFGLEHIFREMGQIYESYISVQKEEMGSNDKLMGTLPKIAAEFLESGFPLELMDGDAAHVPLIWVQAVLDELIKKVGDQRVFVLSVLGIQSSGKSTMLNAMFGLQFAVSAGRCTRGAFMQLIRVSEEMKITLKFDYILVVDTEGLRALELAEKSTRHHDNELATFVVGLGNMTLINIFGENPAEMEDILQIVVQAFLRIKMVRLNPSCMFVHQNVGDITAGEKTMEGRRRLQKKLDEMTKLAATEEDSDAECFNDVITFNLQDDVHYFAQLWEGSPPMAPPNPAYSKNIQLLKEEIFKKASMLHCFTLSGFKTRISDLWKALLNENFVFSFRNTLEIAIYRKLETEFGKWTWSLRKAVLEIEEELIKRIENKQMKMVEKTELYKEVSNTKEEVKKLIKSYFEENKDKDILIQWKNRFESRIEQLCEDLVSDAERNLNDVVQQQKAQETFEQKKSEYDKKLFTVSKEFALKLKNNKSDEKILNQVFGKTWNKLVTELTRDTKPTRMFDIWEDVIQILLKGDNWTSLQDRLFQEQFKDIDRLRNFSHYIILNKVEGDSETSGNKNETNEKREQTKNIKLNVGSDSLRNLTLNVFQETNHFIDVICKKIRRHGYRDSYIQELTDLIKNKVQEHQNEIKMFRLKKEFTLDLCLHVCDKAHHRMIMSNKEFTDKTDIRIYLEKQKPQYYNVFQNYCRGANITTVFSDLICRNLQDSVLQSAYNKTAIDLSTQMRSDMPEFNGNRSQLEKHILKSLAEEENFQKYLQYINDPKEHFKLFIKIKVDEYFTVNNTKVMELFKGNMKDKEEKVNNAVKLTTNEMKMNEGADAETWLRSLNHSLTDELSLKEIKVINQKEITDLEFLQQLVTEGLTVMMSELNSRFMNVSDLDMERFRKKPDEILIEHLCRCCWTQCPFCKAICTNTMEGHDGDHSVPFHRVNGVSGMVYRDTAELCNGFCTTRVQSNISFYPIHDPDKSVSYKKYKTAGGEYAKWSITPDNTECPYWKWFVCRFQSDLEKKYEGEFSGTGEIPAEWKEFTKQQAIESLDEYI